jgi:phosphoglycerate dehydrogenase-like enzyme
MRIVVGIYEPSFWTLPVCEIERLRSLLPDDTIVHTTSDVEYLRELPGAEVLFATHLTRDGLRLATRLRWIQSSAVGVRTIVSPDLVASPVVVTNARGLHAEPIAEHAIALMLALRAGLHVAMARQRERAWAQKEIYDRLVPPLDRTCMAVIGLGAIGARVARLGACFGMTVIGVRKDASRPAPPGVTEVLPADRLVEALGRADVVVLAAPHTTDSRRMLGAAEIVAMKTGSLLINVARGQLVDDKALADALLSGRLGGAGLDAFVPEPLPPESPLWALPNVIITPHTAAFGQDYWVPCVDLFVENLRRFRAGEALINVVDKTRGY